VGLGTLILLLSALGILTPHKTMTIEDRIAAYTKGARPGSAAFGSYQATPRSSAEGLTGSARAMAEKALEGNKGLQARLSARLDAAGMSMKPAEWLLAAVAIAFCSAIFGMLLGSVLLAAVFLLLGIIGPHVYLTFKKSRRIKAFNDQLADTLQLMGGSLLAGLSLAQSADTVVREGTEPMTSEFRRALIEARLGVPLEDGFEAIAERMQSLDFRWVVMAVRIQREVGGNLAEVLNQVSATIRERAYLRRQVRSLSAEGRLSAWILGSLPVGIVAFLSFSRPEYLAPMVTTPLGWMMIAVAAVLMLLGVLWLRQIVKMEV
jgi:tight adherence protein B